MKTVMINASPKRVMKRSVPSSSYALLQLVKRYMKRDRANEITEYHIKTGEMPKNEIRDLFTCDVWLISYPIYFGGLPSHLMSFMDDIYLLSKSFLRPGTPGDLEHPVKIYAIANGGLYDGAEAEPSLNMVKHWCEECGFTWGCGIGVGAGPTFGYAHTVGDLFRLKSSYTQAVTAFSEALSRGESHDHIYCTPAVGKQRYVLRMNRLYKKMSKHHSQIDMDL